ncbi:uncharacterized protein K452DRAFT_327158 [Aplosporella prunicola CBS 121167]|uniref:N-acetyltransferase domain-containing protein n=1 Tax=Aplosporella prunicola CBS 121167 TaxID=1176127 RepID=A0A6A6BBB1_9PEZI|nr:uncharacterized protein K452DRAFT_327158 [Aplosporella prunicola CBS 121167]KAF2141522.1 hypothetical protein K452DRAFT_327158 [Aplosporella prunicola CBS 121167]
MPRPLESEKATLADMPPLTKSPSQAVDNNYENDPGDRLQKDLQKGRQRDELHPLVHTLNPSYIDSCDRLEQAAFPPAERASRDKFAYRLTVCGELSLGLFTTAQIPSAATADAAHLVDSAAPDRKELLLAHVSATKTRNTTVRDPDMDFPPDWRERGTSASVAHDNQLGHHEDGRTVAIHSLAVDPEHQRRGLGRTLLKAYIHRIQMSGVADRIALISHGPLVPFYESLGFEQKGPSSAQIGGGGWIDMVLEFPEQPTMQQRFQQS